MDCCVRRRRAFRRLLIVINKIDHLDPDDRQVAVDFVRSALQDLLGAVEPELFAISARKREGVGPLLDRLRALAAGERESLLLRSVAAVGRIVASETAQAARFESHAIELPLERPGIARPPIRGAHRGAEDSEHGSG